MKQAALALEVQEIGDRAAAWEDYLGLRPDSFYHHLRWKELIETVFGHQCHYRAAFDGSTIRGVLPLVEMNSRLFGHFLVSLPFFNYAGILADDAEAEAALAADAAQLATRRGARHIELRQTNALRIGWPVRQHKVALIVSVPEDPAPLWTALSSRLRGKVRKAANAGASFSVGGPDGVADFYSVFARNMRDMGTPVYSRRLFEAVFRILDEQSRLFLVRLQGRPVAAAIGLISGSAMELPWICSDYGESKYYINEFLYWSVLEWACGQPFSSVDLGRSSIGSGPYRFKKQWNPTEKPLYWYYWTPPGLSLPQLNPENPKYRFAIRCWQKLPLPVANFLGPHIVRNIP